MKILYKNANAAIDGKAVKTDFCVKNQRFDFDLSFPDETVDLRGLTVLPALTDVHTHGAAGYDFNSADENEIPKILKFYYRNGVGGVLPTVMTDSVENTLKQLKIISRAADKYGVIRGINLEGPFLSREYKGAMNEKFLSLPSAELFDVFQEAADGKIKVITVAPELSGAEKFTEYAAGKGVAVSLGHSGASCAQTLRCVKAGAKSFTHAFNAMKPINHHDPSIAVAALLSDAYTEVITDGKHLSPEIVRLLLKIKGLEKIICVTDSISAAGMPDGEYSLAGAPVEVTKGEAFLRGTKTRAGSILAAFDGLKIFAEICGPDLFAASRCFSLNPCKMLGIDLEYGSIENGKYADFTVVNGGKIAATYVKGEKVF